MGQPPKGLFYCGVFFFLWNTLAVILNVAANLQTFWYQVKSSLFVWTFVRGLHMVANSGLEIFGDFGAGPGGGTSASYKAIELTFHFGRLGNREQGLRC